jgi:hypothetical protein
VVEILELCCWISKGINASDFVVNGAGFIPNQAAPYAVANRLSPNDFF